MVIKDTRQINAQNAQVSWCRDARRHESWPLINWPIWRLRTQVAKVRKRLNSTV